MPAKPIKEIHKEITISNTKRFHEKAEKLFHSEESCISFRIIKRASFLSTIEIKERLTFATGKINLKSFFLLKRFRYFINTSRALIKSVGF
jgi:hypothetical protein